MIKTPRFLAQSAPFLTSTLLVWNAFAQADSPVKTEQEALIPKRETGVQDFLRAHPEFDGRGVVIAVFDTGVDPAASGLQKTSTGKRKIVDVIDATGSGDVDTSHTAEVDKDGKLQGLTGRQLTLPKNVKNPSKKFHLGIKRARDLFHSGVINRVTKLRTEAWKREQSQRNDDRLDAEAKADRKIFDKAPADLTLKEKDQIAREEIAQALEKSYASSDPGPVYDCVVWSDGKNFHAVIDTDEDGDLSDEKVLRPYGIAGEHATLSEEEASTFAVQVYEDGNLLSIVTVSGSHGSHVASIAAGHFPDAPHRDGVAPGAQILSVKIGDIRTGGSSNGVGEMRAVAACAQHGADIMNSSWGGASQYQDGGHLGARIYNLLVEKYGVTAFVSAGNSGPALSTLGSPGGDASSVIGVGAYVSSEMARVLYSQTTQGPGTAYNFSARGPAKNGDLGVDIMGPGGAQASLAYDELRQSQRYHGTSMSSPSVAGLGALLVSAAKQSKVEHSPARIRNALMNSARFVKGVEVFAQGAGLVQVAPAWEHLQANAGHKAWDHFYTIRTDNNTFRPGPGLYLRGDIPAGKKEVRFDISPKFADRASAPEKFALEDDLVFTATESWVKVPDYARLANGRITIRPILTIPESRPGQSPLYAEIHGRLAGSPDSGPLIRIPITIVCGQKTDPHQDHRASYSLKLKPGQTNRHFFQVPENANFLKLRVRRNSPDTLQTVTILHAVTLVADDSYYAFNKQEYFVLKGGSEGETIIPVAGGKTTELAFHQPYFSVGKPELQVDMQFIGIDSNQDTIVFHENDKHVPLHLISASNETVSSEGAIDRAHYSQLPEKTEFLSPDKRDEFPPGPRQDEKLSPSFLRQTFTVSVEKPTKIKLNSARRFYAGSEVAGGIITAFHESGKFVYQGSVYRNSDVSLPKGKTTFYRDLRSLDRSVLDREQDRPLAYSIKLEKGKKFELFDSNREVMQGRKAGSVTLKTGRSNSIVVGLPGAASLSSHKPAPTHFSGNFKLIQAKGAKHELFSIRVECRPGAEFKEVANKKKKPESLDEKKPALEKLEEDLFQRQLAFVKASKSSKKDEEKTKRDELLRQLFDQKPKDPDLHLVHATIHAAEAGLISDSKKAKGKKKSLKQVSGMLKKARRLSKANSVAAYFGAHSEPLESSLDDKKVASKKQKKMEAARKRLATIAQVQAQANLSAGNLKAARKSLQEARRWEEKPSKEYNKIERNLLKAEGLHGLALKKLDAQLKDAPFDKKLLEEKIALYKELDLDKRFTARIKLEQKMREHRLALPQ